MDLRGRGEKGWRRIVDVWMYLCLIGMQLSLPALAEEYSSYLQSTGEYADLISSKPETGDKRSSSFFPLRGKKSDLDSPEIPVRYPFVSNQQLDDKRSQFYPLRGKKIPTELKRASYFMPMRGRKDDQEWSEEDSIEKKMSSFMPMRGRKDGEEFSADKRMSSFMPMRGRKDDDESVDAEDSVEKRMSSFMPMRGRKDDYDSMEKRMSFMPMRGKKKSGPMMDGYNHFGKSDSLKQIPFDEEITNEYSSEFIKAPGNNTEEKITDFGTGDKRASSVMPIRGRRGKDYFYRPYPYQLPSGIGSSLMARHYGGKVYPIGSTWSAATKSRKFDWDSVKRAFHATRGKRFNDGDRKEIDEDYKNFVQVPEHGSLENADDYNLSEALVTPSLEKEYKGKGWRYRRSILRPRIFMKSQKNYIALKRPMSFFATRGKRMNNLADEPKNP